MAVNGKTAEQMREEFYEALRLEREAREARSREYEARAEARARAQEEEYRREKEAREESQRLFEERMEREIRLFKEQSRERDEQWKRITSEWGRFTNDEGGMVEYEGVAALRDLPEVGGMRVIDVMNPLQFSRKGREYDGVIICPQALVLLEYKRRVTREHVRKFVDEQLPAFIRDVSLMSNGQAFYGAVVGALIDEDARELAEENGLFAIRIPANRRAEVLNAEHARPLKR